MATASSWIRPGDIKQQAPARARAPTAGTSTSASTVASTVAFTASGDAVSLPTLVLAAVLPATGTEADPLFVTAAAASLLALAVGLNAGVLVLRRSRERRRA